jgi:hypothetical protein
MKKRRVANQIPHGYGGFGGMAMMSMPMARCGKLIFGCVKSKYRPPPEEIGYTFLPQVCGFKTYSLSNAYLPF